MKDPDVREAPACPACGGEGALLGALGFLTWFRCVCCGMDFHVREEKKCPDCGLTDGHLSRCAQAGLS